jgi:hypothetical protein
MLGVIFYQDKNYFITPTGISFDEQKAKTFCKEKKI